MKKLLISLFLVCSMFAAFAQESLPFTKGVNLANYFEYWGGQPGALPPMNKYDEVDFVCLKSMGVDVIRLPISFDILTDDEFGAGKIYEPVLKKLDEVCDWAEKNQIYLIIDNHNNHKFDKQGKQNDFDILEAQLNSVWSQIAPRYANRSDYIIYEIMNEPNGLSASKWYKLQQKLIDVIRTHDTKHSIVVSDINWSNITELTNLKPYNDENLIYTFHFYEPMLFTHQGAAWVGKGMANTSDIPFPYERARMPKLNKAAASDGWVQSMYKEYYNTGTAKYINQRIKKAADWGKKNNVRIFCGEMGAKVWTNPVDRLAWINATRTALETNNISYCCWGLDGSDGFLKSDKAGMIFPDDIDKDALEAYGFTMPDPKLSEKASLNITSQKPYVVYDGISGVGAGKNYWGNIKEIKKDSDRDYCMVISYPGKQNGCNFYLPNKVISLMTEKPQNFTVSFSVKFADNKQEFYLNLSDTDEGAELPPWNISVPVRAADYKVGEWVTVEIPISKLSESGAWSNKANKWFNPQDKFDWSRLECIYFSFNDFDNKNKGDIYIDDIVLKMK